MYVELYRIAKTKRGIIARDLPNMRELLAPHIPAKTVESICQSLERQVAEKRFYPNIVVFLDKDDAMMTLPEYLGRRKEESPMNKTFGFTYAIKTAGMLILYAGALSTLAYFVPYLHTRKIELFDIFYWGGGILIVLYRVITEGIKENREKQL